MGVQNIIDFLISLCYNVCIMSIVHNTIKTVTYPMSMISGGICDVFMSLNNAQNRAYLGLS